MSVITKETISQRINDLTARKNQGTQMLQNLQREIALLDGMINENKFLLESLEKPAKAKAKAKSSDGEALPKKRKPRAKKQD